MMSDDADPVLLPEEKRRQIARREGGIPNAQHAPGAYGVSVVAYGLDRDRYQQPPSFGNEESHHHHHHHLDEHSPTPLHSSPLEQDPSVASYGREALLWGPPQGQAPVSTALSAEVVPELSLSSPMTMEEGGLGGQDRQERHEHDQNIPQQQQQQRRNPRQLRQAPLESFMEGAPASPSGFDSNSSNNNDHSLQGRDGPNRDFTDGLDVKQKSRTRCRRIAPFVIVGMLVVTVAAVVAGIMNHEMKAPTDQHDNGGDVAGNSMDDQDNDNRMCVLRRGAVLGQCEAGIDVDSMVPDCARQLYTDFRQVVAEDIDKMDQNDSDGETASRHCSIHNLSLLSLAVLATNDPAVLSLEDYSTYMALAALYFNTNGPSWENQDGWLERADYCGWHGIQCNQGTSTVTSIYFHKNGLDGTIPIDIGHITGLESLIFEENLSLRGTLPSEIGRLTNLTTLEADRNDLGGTLPTEIFALPLLETLRVSENAISGTIPTEVGLGQSLVTIALPRNRFEGNIPTEIALLSKLEIIDLDTNIISGIIPTEIGRMTGLKRWSCSDNFLDDTIPTQVGNLKSLEYWSSKSSQLSGTLPTELGLLTLSLKTIEVFGNRLNGPIPTEFGNIVQLETLSLQNNRLTGPIPSELGRLTNVQTLVLAINQLTGVIPTELCAMIEYDSSDKAYTESNTGCTERAYGGAFCPSAECCGDCVVWEEDTITDPTKGAT